MLRTAVLCSLTSLAVATNGNRLEGPREFLIDNWQTEHGLPENSATAMVQTPDGYLWFGTFNGLVRFDGQTFRTFDQGNTPELPSAAVVNLHVDRGGRLWISTDYGLAFLEQGRWQRVGVAEGWTAKFAKTFADSPTGELYIGADDARVFRVAGRRVQALEPLPGSAEGELRAGAAFCHIDPAGTLWVATKGFLGRRVDERWEPAVTAEEVSGLQTAAPARDGGLWILDRHSLRRYTNGRLTSRKDVAVPNPWSLSEDSAGNVWVSSYTDGIFRLAMGPDAPVTRFSNTNGLSYNAARFVFEDREGNLWAGTSGGGLHRFKPRQIQQFGGSVGLPELVIKSIAEEAPGRLLIGTHGRGVARLEGGVIGDVTVPQAGSRSGKYVWSLLKTRRGAMLIGTFEAGLFLLENDRLLPIPMEDCPGETINALFEDSRGTVWIGGTRGLANYDGQTFHCFGPEDGLPHVPIICFQEDPRSGVLWVGAHNGALFQRGSDGRFVSTPPPEDIRAGKILSMRIDPDGTVLAGTSDRGLLVRREGRYRAVNEADGLPARQINCVLDDGLGCLWLGSNRGLIRLPRQSLDAYLERRAERLDCQVFNVSDGLAGVEVASGYQPVGLRDSEGRLWFCTMKGVVMVDPRRLRLNAAPPPLVIEELNYHADHPRRTELAGVAPLNSPATQRLIAPFAPHVVLAPGSHQLAIHYTALSFTAPEKMQFEVRLEGSDDKWLPVGQARVAYYHDLSPGDYRFQVRASNNDGLWNEDGATLAFAIRPQFWQTSWFRILAFLAMAAAGGFAVWNLQRRRLREQGERLQQHQAIAAERARFAGLTNATSDLVSFLGPDGSPLFLNGAGLRLLQLSGNPPVAGLKPEAFLTEAARDLARRIVLPSLAADGIWSGETSLRPASGEAVAVHLVAIVHRKPDGQPDYYSVVARDITERNRALADLAQSEQRFRALIDSAPLGAHEYELRPDGRLVFVGANRASDRILGVNCSQFIGKTIEEAFPGLRETEVPEAYRRVATTGVPYEHTNVTYRDRHVSGAFELAAFQTGSCRMAVLFRDVTERRRVEQALQESEQRFRMLSSASFEGIALTQDGVVVDVNDELVRLLGYHRSELVGRPMLDLVAPESREIVKEAARKGLTKPYEHFYLRKDGSVFPVEVRARTLESGNGRLRLSAVRDMTQRKQSEQALRESEERFRSIVQLATDVITVLDRRGAITYISPQGERTLGYPPAELVGHTPFEFCHPEDLPMLQRVFAQVLDRTNSGRPTEFRFRHRQGHWLTIESLAVNHLDHPGIRGVLVMTRDVTERKEAEIAVLDSEQRFRALFDSSNEAIFLHDPATGATCDVNARACDLYGFTHGRLCAASFDEISEGRPPYTKIEAQAWMAKVMTVGPQTFEWRARDSLGRSFWVEIRMKVLTIRDELRILTSVNDISARKQVEEQIRELNSELDRRVQERTAELTATNRELEAFCYSVSHDLRTPLRAIDGFSHAVLDDFGEVLGEDGRLPLHRVRRASQHLGRLIDDLLKLSRLTRAEMKRETIDLSALANEIITQLRAIAPDRMAEVSIAPGLTVAADPSLLRVVFENLLDNAWKYTCRETCSRIEVGTQEREGERVFYVRDNGVGFDMQFVGKLFGPFQRLHPQEEFGGTGVGLATVQRIILRHGGRVWAEGQVGKGATFYFTLPARILPPPPEVNA